MKKRATRLDPAASDTDPLDEEIDMSGARHGQFIGRLKDMVVTVVLEPDVAAAIKSDKEVNRVLRQYIRHRADRRRDIKPRRRGQARAGR